MANRNLSTDELQQANDLLERIRQELAQLAGGDEELLFAFRRKIYKELTYDERGKPMHRKKLKMQKYAEQEGICLVCGKKLPASYTVLDRFVAHKGYTAENTRLIHSGCDQKVQKERGYA